MKTFRICQTLLRKLNTLNVKRSDFAFRYVYCFYKVEIWFSYGLVLIDFFIYALGYTRIIYSLIAGLVIRLLTKLTDYCESYQSLSNDGTKIFV